MALQFKHEISHDDDDDKKESSSYKRSTSTVASCYVEVTLQCTFGMILH